MKIPNTNIDMELWAEIGVLVAGLEEYGVDTKNYRDDNLEKMLVLELDKIPKDEQETLEEVLKNHTLSVFINKYAEFKRQYNGEVQ